MDNINIYAYLRVSTDLQNIDNNKNNIIVRLTEEGFNASKITWITETVTGKKHWRKRKLNEIVEKINKDDVFITSEISRIGRTYIQIVEFLSLLLQKGCKIFFCNSKFKVDESINSQALLFAFSISAQLERELISQRTKIALQKRKASGAKLGRTKGSFKLNKYKEEIKEQLDQGIKQCVLSKKYNCSNYTMSKFIKVNDLKNKNI